MEDTNQTTPDQEHKLLMTCQRAAEIISLEDGQSELLSEDELNAACDHFETCSKCYDKHLKLGHEWLQVEHAKAVMEKLLSQPDAEAKLNGTADIPPDEQELFDKLRLIELVEKDFAQIDLAALPLEVRRQRLLEFYRDQLGEEFVEEHTSDSTPADASPVSEERVRNFCLKIYGALGVQLTEAELEKRVQRIMEAEERGEPVREPTWQDLFTFIYSLTPPMTCERTREILSEEDIRSFPAVELHALVAHLNSCACRENLKDLVKRHQFELRLHQKWERDFFNE